MTSGPEPGHGWPAAIDEMLTLVREQRDLYGELLELARRKRRALVQADLTELDRVVRAEESTVWKASKVEERRMALQRTLVSELTPASTRTDDWTVSRFLEHIPEGPERSRFEAAWRDLATVIAELGRLNEQNQALIQQSLRYVEASLELLERLDATNYDAGGRRAATKSSRRRAVDKRV